MAQQQEPQHSIGTYEAMLREQGRDLEALRIRSGDRSYREIDQRAKKLFFDEKPRPSLSLPTLNALFNGRYAGQDKLLLLVRTLMSWDRYGRDCEPPSYADPELEPWNDRWLAIREARKSSQRTRTTPDLTVPEIDRLLQQAFAQREEGALDQAEEHFWSALHLAVQHGAKRQEGWAWDGLGSCRWRSRDPEMALRFFTLADRIADETDFADLKAWCLYNFGQYHHEHRGDLPTAKDFFEQALTVADTHHCYAAAGWTHYHLAGLARAEGDDRQEREHCEAAVRIGQDSHQDGLTGWSLTRLARCAENSGDLSQAREHFAHALEIGTRIHHEAMVQKAEKGLARIADRD